MSQRLKIRAPTILGLLGSIVGLLYSYAVMSNDGYGCSLCSTDAEWSFIQTFLGWPLIIGSLLLFSVLFFAPSYFASLLLFLGGLLAFQKTRRIIKRLHDGGWIP